MISHDFSRIREVFLDEVGDAIDDVRFENFIKHALKSFADRYLRSRSVVHPHSISYRNSSASLSLTVFGSNGQPNMSRCRFQGFFHGCTDDVVKQMPEAITVAEFDEEANISNLTQFLQKHLVESEERDVTIGLLNVQRSQRQLKKLTLHPLTLNICKHIVDEKKRHKFMHERHLERSVSRLLFHEATKLSLKQSRYDDDSIRSQIRSDDRGQLVHESCILIRKSSGYYFLEYEVQSASEIRSLTATTMKNAMHFFSMVQNSFSLDMLGTIQMIDSTRKAVND